MDRRIGGVALALVAIALLAAAFYFSQNLSPQPVHIHADFKVYLDGTAFNFSKEKYMSAENATHDAFFHVHDLNGEIMHQHLSGLKLERFFHSLNMTFNSTCFVTDEKASFCNGNGKTLEMYVKHAGGEWQRNYEFGDYQIQDVDRVLITYGTTDESTLKQQMGSVTDLACMYSEKCPERGNPPTESCTGENETC